MKIVIAAAELSEVASVGGVGEYALGLAGELVVHGHDVEVVIPLYGYLSELGDLEPFTDRLPVPLGVGASERVTVRRWPADRLPFRVTLIAAHRHFASVASPADIYDHWPNHEPWIAFSRAVLEYLRLAESDPDIIHCLDSHAAAIPIFMHEEQRHHWGCPPSRPATVLTIHNLLNQGRGDPAVLGWAGLPPGYWFHDWFEFYGGANCYKAGLLTADRVSTVSRTYAEEICQSSDFGFGLEGVLASLRDRRRLEWVLNGITPERWSSPGITYGAGAGTADVRRIQRAKSELRRRLLPTCGWKDDGSPVVAVRTRWDRQKGVVELVECIRRSPPGVRFLVVAWGLGHSSPALGRAWRALREIQAERPDGVCLNPAGLEGQQNGAFHYGVADFLLVPSWYEPCGLTQLECQRYGTIPIVRNTGGLADTVSESETPDFPSPNGFAFTEPLGEHMAQRISDAVGRAVGAFGTAAGMDMILRTLQQDHSWSSRISDYETLYRRAADSRFDAAIGCLSQRVAVMRSQDDRRGEAATLRELGAAYAGRGQMDEARVHWRHAHEVLQGLGSAEADEIELLLR